MPQRSQEESRSPVDKFHDGHVHVSIWENDGIKGAFRTASFQLRYKDKQTDAWQTGTSYGPSDLERLERATKEARTRIQSWYDARKTSHKPKSAA
jgi:hypothetical protein